MRIRDLIQKLSFYPQDAELVVDSVRSGYDKISQVSPVRVCYPVTAGRRGGVYEDAGGMIPDGVAFVVVVIR